ncbi:MAG: TonB-dependent receptor [Saprospiraceae bacterium]|nr:TonB-dependent receptor [Saprospiraceae bacterium]
MSIGQIHRFEKLQIASLILVFLLTHISVSGQQLGGLESLIFLPEGELTVGEILSSISDQSGIDFSFNAKTIDEERRVSFGSAGLTAQEAVASLCKILDVDFKIQDGQFILFKEKTAAEVFQTISGFIRDSLTGETLIGATVSILGTSKGTVTNGFGYYSLRVLTGKQRLQYAYIGYQSEIWETSLTKDTRKSVQLSPTPLELPNVIVSIPVDQEMERHDLDRFDFSTKALNNMPEFGGEAGLVKGLQSLPGIKMHSDGSAFFYTRGGEKDQNLIIIDDAPIFNPAHLFGFYSVVIPDFAKDIKVYKSDVPANLGDRLSSIISIRTRDGNLNKWHLSGAVNPLINRLSLEVPVSRGKSSLFTSVRRSNFDWLGQDENDDPLLAFGDFNFKWNQRINKNNRLFFTLITAVDALNTQDGTLSGINWGNAATTLRWNHLFGPRLFSNTTIYAGVYNYRLGFMDNAWESGIGTASIKSDFTHYISPSFESRFGVEFAGYGFNPGSISTGSLLSILPEINELAARKRIFYYQANFKATRRLHLKMGFRMSTWENSGPVQYYTYDESSNVADTIGEPEGPYHRYRNVDPRISIQYRLDSSAHLKFSYGSYHQYLQLISNSVSPFTSLEVWLPSNPNIKPQAAHQWTLGYQKYFNRTKWSFGLTSYYKKLYNQIDYVPHAHTLLNPHLVAELRFGTMDAYGMEVLVRKEVGKLNGWMSYTWSKALRNTPSINGGRTYPAFQDRPHDFSLMLNYQVSRRMLLSTYFTAYTGSAFSSPTSFYTFQGKTVPIYDEKNNDRLPSYRRMDLALKFRLNRNLQQRFQHSLTFSVYNVLAHKNIVAVNFNKILDKEDVPVVQANFLRERDLVSTQTDLVRFLPSLTYKFEL